MKRYQIACSVIQCGRQLLIALRSEPIDAQEKRPDYSEERRYSEPGWIKAEDVAIPTHLHGPGGGIDAGGVKYTRGDHKKAGDDEHLALSGLMSEAPKLVWIIEVPMNPIV